jgi:hypothetical protein
MDYIIILRLKKKLKAIPFGGDDDLLCSYNGYLAATEPGGPCCYDPIRAAQPIPALIKERRAGCIGFISGDPKEQSLF